MSRRKSRVPSTRLGRLTRLGLTAGELALGGAAESIRRLSGGRFDEAVSVFLNTSNARKLARRLAGMRGAAMKMGQLLSMEGANLLPSEFAEALATLRDSANTMPRTQVRRLLGREYGKGWEDRFENFEYEPVAAASIGQVHRAQTLDGRDLALKIQYPGIARSIDSDVDNLAMLLQLARVLPVEMDLDGLIAEAKLQLKQEADYTLEAGYLRDYRALVSEDEHFVVPKVHEDFTTKRILAMDYLTGEAIETLGEEGVAQEERDRVAALLERLLFRELFEFRTMQSDPNFANYFYRPSDGRIVLLDFGSTVRFSQDFTERYRRIARALIEDDTETAWRCAEAIGYFDPEDSPAHAERVMEVLRLVCEPIRQDEEYDFGGSNLMSRSREAGLDMMLRSAGEFRPPPPQTAFLHRKLVGSFLICARIKARVNVHALIWPYLVED